MRREEKPLSHKKERISQSPPKMCVVGTPRNTRESRWDEFRKDQKVCTKGKGRKRTKPKVGAPRKKRGDQRRLEKEERRA